MEDVFLSYASSDLDRVQPLAEAMKDAGFSVWWDRQLSVGSAFDQEIERALDAAACVVVVWSHNSVNSDWVREEAADGQERDILVPIQIDDCRRPLGFRRMQHVLLIGWPHVHYDLTQLFEAMASLVGNPVKANTQPSVASRRAALAASTSTGVPVLDLDAFDTDVVPRGIIADDLIVRYGTLPLTLRGSRLVVAVSDVEDLAAIDVIQEATGLDVERVIVEPDKLEALIQRYLR